MIPVDNVLLGIAILLMVSVIASKAAARLGVPALLLFLIIGMLAGSEGPGAIYLDDPWPAQLIGVLALSLILFAGGLDTDWIGARSVFWRGLSLSTLGVFSTAALLGLFVSAVTDFSLLEGMLLGAIISSTDAAAVFAVLRSKKVSLKGQLRPLLELESGSNDPMAVFLTIGLIGLLLGQVESIPGLVPLFIMQMTIGAGLGFALGKAMVFVVNRVGLEYEGLYPVLTLSLVLLGYGITDSLGGNGFLAVYIAGILMGNSSFIHKRSLMRFHDGLAWLTQIAMFLTLGLLVFPSHLVPVAGVGLLISLFLLLIARPVSVFIVLAFTGLTIREKAMVSWVGLRGAVPIILATFPLLAGIDKAEPIFNVVFFVVLTSALLQGTSIPLIARLLRVDAPVVGKPRYPLEFEASMLLESELIEDKISDYSPIAGKRILDVALPENTLIVLILRGEKFIIPSGATVLEAGDELLLLADKNQQAAIRAMLGRGPSAP